MLRMELESKLKSLVLALTLSATASFSFAQETVEVGSEEFGEAVRAYLLENPEVIFEAVEVYEIKQQQAANAAAEQALSLNQDKIYNEQGAVVLGNPDAEFAIVEFVDYNCGYCRKAHEDMAVILENNPDVKMLVRQLPILSQGSLDAAKVVLATSELYGNEAAAVLHNSLYDEAQNASLESALALASAQGHDEDEIKAELESQKIYNELAEVNELAEALQIEGTPGFVVGDEMLRGYVPAASMQAIIDQKKS